MSKCANYQCPNYGEDHPGVGQSPEHPVDTSFWWPIGILVVVALIVVVITL